MRVCGVGDAGQESRKVEAERMFRVVTAGADFRVILAAGRRARNMRPTSAVTHLATHVLELRRFGRTGEASRLLEADHVTTHAFRVRRFSMFDQGIEW